MYPAFSVCATSAVHSSIDSALVATNPETPPSMGRVASVCGGCDWNESSDKAVVPRGLAQFVLATGTTDEYTGRLGAASEAASEAGMSRIIPTMSRGQRARG